jgi:hypothetical protein
MTRGNTFFPACVLILLLGAISCVSGCSRPDTGPAGRNSSGSTNLDSLPTAKHDLSKDEAEGGHTLSRHTGKSDAELRQRLARERRIAAASTYTDRETAEDVIGETLNQQKEKIQTWLQKGGEHPNLVLDYEAQQPIGRTLRRNQSAPVPCNKAIIVLRYAGGGEYYVLTSYPECRG